MTDEQHRTWRMIEWMRIRRQADAAHEEIRRMSTEAMDSIKGRVSFYIRSEAQRKRWAFFNTVTKGSK